MSRNFFMIEKGIHMVGENAETGAKILFGSGAPAMDAEIGSIYQRTDGSGLLYRKTVAGAGGGNWEKVPELSDIVSVKFRPEQVVALTAQAAPSSGTVIDLVAVPLTGDEAPTLVAADFTAGVSHILFGQGGTEKLMKVSVVSGDEITVIDVTPALSTGDTFVVKHYLPDSPDAQEKEALVTFNGTDYVKIGDVNWSSADAISLTAGYTAASGNVLPADTVQAAIQKLDGVNDAQDQTLGVSQGATNLGTFTGATIPDSSTVKGALQSLETKVESLHTLSKAVVTGITTITTIDQLLVDSYSMAKWLVVVKSEADLANKKAFEVNALNNGKPTADATSIDDTVFAKLNVGSNFTANVSVDLNGTGASQYMRLRVDAPSAVTVEITRLEVA
jgi:hypothetical protein